MNLSVSSTGHTRLVDACIKGLYFSGQFNVSSGLSVSGLNFKESVSPCYYAPLFPASRSQKGGGA